MCVYVYIYRMELSNIYKGIYMIIYEWGWGLQLFPGTSLSPNARTDRDNFMTPEEAKDPSAAVPDHRLTMI